MLLVNYAICRKAKTIKKNIEIRYLKCYTYYSYRCLYGCIAPIFGKTSRNMTEPWGDFLGTVVGKSYVKNTYIFHLRRKTL